MITVCVHVLVFTGVLLKVTSLQLYLMYSTYAYDSDSIVVYLVIMQAQTLHERGRTGSTNTTTMTISGTLQDVFKKFLAAREFKQTLETFRELCSRLNLDASANHLDVYSTLKQHLGNECTHLWKCLDKRKSNVEYGDGKICNSATVCIMYSTHQKYMYCLYSK